jgi:hypothetical protein
VSGQFHDPTALTAGKVAFGTCYSGRLAGCTRVYTKVSGLSRNEIYAYNNKHSSRSDTKGYGGRTH